MDPASASQLGLPVIEEFRQHQQKLLDLIRKAGQTDISKGNVKVEFFKLLKMTSGEALEFVITHELRHIQQAQRATAIKASDQKPVLIF